MVVGQRGQQRFGRSLGVAEPPVVVDVVHRHLDTVEVEALQVGDQRGNLSLADHVVVGLLRPVQAHQRVGRFNHNHAGTAALRADVEDVIHLAEIGDMIIRRHDIILRVGLPLQPGVVAVEHEPRVAFFIVVAEYGTLLVDGLGKGVLRHRLEIGVPLEVHHAGAHVCGRSGGVPNHLVAKQGSVEGCLIVSITAIERVFRFLDGYGQGVEVGKSVL